MHHSNESKKIKLYLGDTSLNKELGIYYIDMRPAIIHYTNNIYGGKFDDNGVPMIKIRNDFFYSPVNIAQYGFILHAQYIEKKESKILSELTNCLFVLEKIKIEKEEYCVWLHNYEEEKYKISKPWPSSMAQGEVISFYLRMYQILKEPQLFKTAEKAYKFLKIDYADGGVRRYIDGDLWLEEYPSEKPSLVLNGFIYTLFGLYDLYRMTGSLEVKNDIDACINTLKKNIHKYNVGYWSIYDLQKKELVRYYYQKNVHVLQMKILYFLTNEHLFLKYAQKWEKQITILNFLFVQIMYRIRPRLNAIIKFD